MSWPVFFEGDIFFDIERYALVFLVPYHH